MKKLLAAVLAIALVITGLYPVQLVGAAPTTAQNEGLNFDNRIDNGGCKDVDYWYYSEEKLENNIQTFEATIKPTGSWTSDLGVILANTDGKTPGTFKFGIRQEKIGDSSNPRPYLAVVDSYDNSTGAVWDEYFISYNKDMESVIYSGCTIVLVNDQESNTLTVYMNGQEYGHLDRAYKGDFTDPGTGLCVGGIYKDKWNCFKGDIKKVALYSEALEVNEDGVVNGEDSLIASYTLGLNENGSYPKEITSTTNKYDLISQAPEFISEAAAKELSGRGENYDFAMAIIGDPQTLVANDENYGRTDAATLFNWVADNAAEDKKNIKFVFNMGDTTDSYVDPNKSDEENEANSDKEWPIGSEAVKRLNNKVPYSIIRGNHDAEDKYKNYFSWEDYKGTNYIKGYFGTEGNLLNYYQTFEVEDIKYMVMNLDWGISGDPQEAASILQWANNIVEEHPDHNVIVTTHGYLNHEGERLKGDEPASPTRQQDTYYRAKDGEAIWNEFVKKHENIVMVLSGHIATNDEIIRNNATENGHTVVELAVNFQDTDARLESAALNRAGIVTMLYFTEDGKKVSLETYSTLRDKYLLEGNQFQFELDLVESEKIYEKDNGAIAVPVSMVKDGEIPVVDAEGYEDYLFAGWYSSAACTLDTAIVNTNNVKDGCYAKFIPTEVLTVKAQVSTSTLASGEEAGNWAMRFISSVEGVNYKNVGFKVTNGSEELTSSDANVYSKIASTEAEVNCNFSPGVISKNSEYFFTAKLAVADTDAAKATDYTVQAYVETFDGTKVYGPARVVRLNDGLDNTNINMLINTELDPDATYTVSCKTGNGVNTEVAQGTIEILSSGLGYSSVRIPLSSSSLSSASRVTISNADGVVATEVYRNYYTKYAGGEGDYSWYNVDEAATEKVIASSADLFGFNKLMEWGNTFGEKTVRQVADIVLNEITVTPGTEDDAPTWAKASDNTVYKWNTGGGEWGHFNGIYDGGGNTISGLVIDGDIPYGEGVRANVGLFGSLNSKAIIRNLGITNSYIGTSAPRVGSFVGYSGAGRLENLYSDAVINSSYNGGERMVGGIAGMIDSFADGNTHVVSGCWFNGQVYCSSDKPGGAGIVGQFSDNKSDSKFELYDCLFSGSIYVKASWSDAAGIVQNLIGTGKPEVIMKNCLNTGTIAGDSANWCRGLFVNFGNAASGSVEKCYAIKSDIYTNYGDVGCYLYYKCGGMEVPKEDIAYVERTSLLLETEADLNKKLSLLSGQTESAWMCNTFGDAAETPILKAFANVYLQK